MSATSFRYLHHLVTVPVVANHEVETRFVLDTGIGLTLFSDSLCRAVGCTPNGLTYTGRRMSGQEVTVQLASADALSMGLITREHHAIGVFDMNAFPADFDGIDGFLSLAFFAQTPFTVDYPRRVVVVENEESLATRAKNGRAVDVQVVRHDSAVDVFLPLTVPGRGRITVEVDMGSDSLILNEELAAELGVRFDDPAVNRVDGEDETGHAYTRYFTAIHGDIYPTGAPTIRQANPAVMFQRVIYDGLVGDSFLRNFVVTYDLDQERMIFASPR